MTDPATIQTALVAALKTNTALVTLLGSSSANITSYVPTYPTAVNSYAAIQKMNPPSILVAYTGTLCNDRIAGIEHQFSIYLCPSGAVTPLFVAIREGVVTTTTTPAVTGKLKLVQLTTLTHPPDIRGCYSRSIVIGEAIFEYWEIPVRVTDRGLDN